MPLVKTIGTAVIRKLVFLAPWGAREAMLDACIDRIGASNVSVRVMKRIGLVEVAANGDCGVVSSSWNDTAVLPEYARTGRFAETVTATAQAFFAKHPTGGTFMDIGANIGLTTIPIARNALVHCLTFEPESTNFGFLQRNIARNAPGSDVEFHQIALWHSQTVMSLTLAEGNIGDHRLSEIGGGERKRVEVQALPLDHFLDSVRGPLAIKMDTQGAEPHIIAGGQKVFAKAGLVAIEFCPFLMRQLGGDPEVVIDYLSGFDSVAIMPGGRSVQPRYSTFSEAQRTLKEKLLTATDNDGDYLDILATRDSTASDKSLGT